MRVLLALLFLPLVSAQWSFLSRLLQQPLAFESTTSILARLIQPVNDSNWQEMLHPTARDEAVAEWLLYFTAPHSNPAVALHDGIFNKTILALAAATPSPHFGKIVCPAEQTGTVCASFFQSGIRPSFWHVLSGPRTKIRRLPVEVAETEEEGVKYLKSVFEEEAWRGLMTWGGVWNPVDGVLKWAAPVMGRMWGIWERGL